MPEAGGAPGRRSRWVPAAPDGAAGGVASACPGRDQRRGKDNGGGSFEPSRRLSTRRERCRPVIGTPAIFPPWGSHPFPGGPARRWSAPQSPPPRVQRARSPARPRAPSIVRSPSGRATRGSGRTRHRGPGPESPAFRPIPPGPFEIPLPVGGEAPTPSTRSGRGLASVAAEGGTLYTAAKTFGRRGEVESGVHLREGGPREQGAPGRAEGPTAPGSCRSGRGSRARSSSR